MSEVSCRACKMKRGIATSTVAATRPARRPCSRRPAQATTSRVAIASQAPGRRAAALGNPSRRIPSAGSNAQTWTPAPSCPSPRLGGGGLRSQHRAPRVPTARSRPRPAGASRARALSARSPTRRPAGGGAAAHRSRPLARRARKGRRGPRHPPVQRPAARRTGRGSTVANGGAPIPAPGGAFVQADLVYSVASSSLPVCGALAGVVGRPAAHLRPQPAVVIVECRGSCRWVAASPTMLRTERRPPAPAGPARRPPTCPRARALPGLARQARARRDRRSRPAATAPPGGESRSFEGGELLVLECIALTFVAPLSPRSSTSRRAARARDSRDLTVPTSRSRAAAISG